MVLEDLDRYMQKKKKRKETTPPTYTIHQNKLEMDKRLKYKLWHHKNPRGKHRKISDIQMQQYFHRYIYPLGQGT